MQRSEKQIAASRANGAKSKGAITPAGQRISSRNGKGFALLATAVLFEGESRSGFADLFAAYEDEFQPSSPSEQDFVESMVVARWCLQRSWALQSEAINHAIGNQPNFAADGAHYSSRTRAMLAVRETAGNSPHLEQMSRDEQRFERQFSRSFRNLVRFQAEKRVLRGNTQQQKKTKDRPSERIPTNIPRQTTNGPTHRT